MDDANDDTDLDRVIRMSTPKAPVQARAPAVVPPPAKARPPVQEAATPAAVEIHGPVPGRGMHWRHGWLNKCIPLITAHQVGDQEQVHALLQWLATLPQVQVHTAPKSADGVAKILSRADVEKLKSQTKRSFVLECEPLGFWKALLATHAGHIVVFWFGGFSQESTAGFLGPHRHH